MYGMPLMHWHSISYSGLPMRPGSHFTALFLSRHFIDISMLAKVNCYVDHCLEIIRQRRRLKSRTRTNSRWDNYWLVQGHLPQLKSHTLVCISGKPLQQREILW